MRIDLKGWKVLTHHYCSPLQGGAPIWDGKTLPFVLPPVDLDTGTEECAPGWNFCESLDAAFLIAGLWPTGRPSVAVAVEGEAIRRGNKCRAATLIISRRATDHEIESAIRIMSAPFGKFAEDMAREQMAWRLALSRPKHDKAAVMAALNAILIANGLEWSLKEYPAAKDARDAWDARDAKDASDALLVFFAVKKNWINKIISNDYRRAFVNGLLLAHPTGKNTLGWVMDKQEPIVQ